MQKPRVNAITPKAIFFKKLNLPDLLLPYAFLMLMVCAGILNKSNTEQGTQGFPQIYPLP